MGTSKGLIRNFHTVNYTASIYGFQNFNKTKIANRLASGNLFVYNSLLNTRSVQVNGPAFIEGCCLGGKTRLDGENILTGIPRGIGDVSLKKGICATCVPVEVAQTGLPGKKSGWAAIIYGTEDSFKSLAEDDEATYLNEGFASWVATRGVSSTDLWIDDETRGLWNARLFPYSLEPPQ